MSYATLAQLQARYDSRTIGQVSNDANGVTGNTANVQAALDDATAEIQIAATQGSIYTRDQLDALAASNDPAIVRMCATLAMGRLWSRRGQGVPDRYEAELTDMRDLVNMMRQGTRVFDVPSNRTADLPATVVMTANDSFNLGLITTTPFFGPPFGTTTTNGSY